MRAEISAKENRPRKLGGWGLSNNTLYAISAPIVAQKKGKCQAMRVCIECGCYCDPGETINGVCIDCIEEEHQQEERRYIVRKMLARHIVEQVDGQLSFVQ